MAKELVDKYGIPRVRSGIKGLDNLISGGFVKGNQILLAGAPGTGKTLLALQFLIKGAIEDNEPGLFVSIEDHPDRLTMYGKTFGWDLQGLIKEKKLDFVNIPIDQMRYNIVRTISEHAHKIKAKRLILDSLSALNFNAKMFELPLENQPDPTGVISSKRILHIAGYEAFEDVHQFTYLFLKRLSELNITTLVITDSPENNLSQLTKDGVSEYVTDGVLHLELHDTSQNVNRTISVKKMRGGSIIPGKKTLKFTKTGLEVGEYKVFY